MHLSLKLFVVLVGLGAGMAQAEWRSGRRNTCPQVIYCPATQVCPQPPSCTFPSAAPLNSGAAAGCRLECSLRAAGAGWTVSAVRKSYDNCAPFVCDERAEVCENFIRGMTFSSNTTAVFVPSTCRADAAPPAIKPPVADPQDGPKELRIKLKRTGSRRIGLNLTHGDESLGILEPSESEQLFKVRISRLGGKEKFQLHGNLSEESGARLTLLCGKDRKPFPLGKPQRQGNRYYYDLPLPSELSDSLDCDLTADLTGSTESGGPYQCCFCEIGSNPKDKAEDEDKCGKEFTSWGRANKTFCDITETRVKTAILVDPTLERTSISRDGQKYKCENAYMVSADHSYSGQLKCFVDSVANMLDTVSKTNHGQTGKAHLFELKDCGCAGGSDLKNGVPPDLLREIERKLKGSPQSAVAELTLNQTTVTFSSTSWVKLKIDVEGYACKKNGESTATVKIEVSYIPCKELFDNSCSTYLGATAKCDWDGKVQPAKCCHPAYSGSGHSWYLSDDCRRVPPCEYDGTYLQGLKGAALYPKDVGERKLIGASCSAADVPLPYSCKKKDGTEQSLICQNKELTASDRLECRSLFGSPTICYQPGKTLSCLEGDTTREAMCCYDFSFPKGNDPAHPPWERFYSKWKLASTCAAELDGGDCDVLAKKWCAEEPAQKTYQSKVTCDRKGKRCQATCSPSGEFDLDRGTPWIIKCPGDSDGSPDAKNHE